MIDFVSIVMPAHNAMPYIKEAVQSVLAQTFMRYEFIIVDDGSSDDTKVYLDSLTDSRIRVIHQTNLGIVAALNEGIHEAKHEWIARMDADDVALPKRVQRQVEFLEKDSQYSLISCAWGYIGRNGRQMKATQQHILKQPPYYRPLTDQMILDQGMLFKKSAVMRVGGYRGIGNSSEGSEGIDLCLRLDEGGYRMTSVPNLLMLVRVLPSGISARRFIQQRVMRNFYQECSNARRLGKGEPDKGAYIREHWPRGFRLMRYAGAREFRLAGSEWGAGHYLSAAWRLFLGSILYPRYVLTKFRTYFLNK